MKLLRISTVPTSLNTFCRGLLRDLHENEGYEVVAVSSPAEELGEIAEREGVKVIPVKMERHISPWKDLVSLFRLIQVFRREKPDMVHSITPKAGLLSMIAAWVSRVPVRLHTFTGLVFPTATGITQKILILTDRITCACATHIVPEGEGVKADLINYKITKKPMKVLGHGNIRGIDLDYYNPDLFKNEKKQYAPFTFIFVGRLVRDKGINELIGAFSRLNKAYPNTKLLLVGRNEPELDPLSDETNKEIELNPAIKAVGNQQDVRPWLAKADVLVFPSYREGFPNVVIEAGAMNLPSIVTNINGSREIIIHGENGIIIPPHDQTAIYEAMCQLIETPELVKKMRKRARPLIASRYEQSFVRKCLKDYYRQIFSEKPLGSSYS